MRARAMRLCPNCQLRARAARATTRHAQPADAAATARAAPAHSPVSVARGAIGVDVSPLARLLRAQAGASAPSFRCDDSSPSLLRAAAAAAAAALESPIAAAAAAAAAGSAPGGGADEVTPCAKRKRSDVFGGYDAGAPPARPARIKLSELLMRHHRGAALEMDPV
jgi:hypothetical protein